MRLYGSNRFVGRAFSIMLAFAMTTGALVAFLAYVPSASATVYFFDDFEGGIGNWAVGGYWHSVEDTVDPCTIGAHSGTRSIGYHIDASCDYDDGAQNSGTAELAVDIDLTTATVARLTFKSWLEDEPGAAYEDVEVHISDDGGATWSWIAYVNDPTYPRALWSQVEINLTSFVGSNVRIRFLFDTFDGWDNAWRGWFIDDVMVDDVPIPTTDFFRDDFETGSPGWLAEAGSLWHEVDDTLDPCVGPPNDYQGAYTAVTAWGYHVDATCDFDVGTNTGWLRSPWIPLWSAASPMLSFWTWFETETSIYDLKYVQLTTDGTTWTNLTELNAAGFKPGIWQYVEVDLSAWTVSSIRIRFLFDSVDGSGNFGEGWYVDNVTVDGLSNDPPILEWTGEPNYVADGVHPERADEGTMFEWRISYRDPNDNPPEPGHPLLHVYGDGMEIPGSPLSMAEVDPLDTEYWDGKLYSVSLAPLCGANYSYNFEANDSVGLSTSIDTRFGPHVLCPNTPPYFDWTGEPNYVADGLDPEVGDDTTTFTYRIDFYDDERNMPMGGDPAVHILDGGAEVPGSPFTMAQDNPVLWYLYEDFETGSPGWTGDGLWHEVNDAMDPCSIISWSGTHSWGYHADTSPPAMPGEECTFNEDDGTGTSKISIGNLTSPTFDLTTASSATLSFWTWFETEWGNAYDRKWIRISDDGFVTSTDLLQLQGGVHPTGQWFQVEIDLSPFIPGTYQIGFFFDTVDTVANSFRGWFVDEVGVYEGDADTTDGKRYTFDTTLPCGGTYSYYFSGSDEKGLAATPTTELFAPAVQCVPALDWTGEPNYVTDGLDPETGNALTLFEYRIQYSDADNDAPAPGYPELHILDGGVDIPGSPFAMNLDVWVGAPGDYVAGAIYNFVTNLPASPNYEYWFYAEDATFQSAQTPILQGPTVNFDSPVLDWTAEPNYVGDGLDPETGDTTTTFEYRIQYSDADNDAPAAGFPEVHILDAGVDIAGSPFQMTFLSWVGAVDDYQAGARYSYTMTLPVGTNYEYWFYAEDGIGLSGQTAPLAGPVVNPPGAAPALDWTGEPNYVMDGLNPETGNDTTVFEYRIQYSDADNDAPAAGFPEVHILDAGVDIAGSPFQMTFLSWVGAVDDYQAGARYSYSTTLPVGSDYSYYFYAEDGIGLVGQTPTMSGPTVAPLGNDPPEATDLLVDSNLPGSAGILHITSATPMFEWGYSDPNGDAQTDYQVRIGTAPGLGDMWDFTGGGPGLTVVYAGLPLADGTDYYFQVRVRDNVQWSLYNTTVFHTNAVPPPPTDPTVPLDGGTTNAGAGTTVSWTPGGPDPDGDTVTYYWQVATDQAFTNMVASGSTTSTTSGGFTTAISTTYYWRVNATDDYESSAYGNVPPGWWMFNTSTVVNDPPVASGPGVDGFLDGSGGIMHILSATPALNWTYLDPESVDQAEYEVRVGTQSGFSDMWSPGNVTGNANSVTYGGSTLADGTDYYFGVRVSDGEKWSDWVEVLFHMNTPPPIPTLDSPANGTADIVPGDIDLSWSSVSDAEGDAITYYWYLSDQSDFTPLADSGSTTSTTATITVQPETTYYWKVEAYDGYELSGNSTTSEFTTVSATGTITGTVLDDSNDEPIQGVTVELLDSNDDVVETDVTNLNGQFEFTDVDFGTYSVRVTKSGYEDYTETGVEISSSNPDEDLTIRLKKTVAPPIDWMLILIPLIIIIIIVVILLVLLMKRKKPEEAPPAQPPPAAEQAPVYYPPADQPPAEAPPETPTTEVPPEQPPEQPTEES
ncbi:MAG: carboxypeptidase regulatory-like domain-containing protein [Thermoplasmata archaeon]